MSGAERIAAERQRQIDAEGWTPEHDDEHDDHSLVYAAICYASPDNLGDVREPLLWPWATYDWKPSPDPIRNLVRAGALIAAEIDRLERRAVPEPPEEGEVER